MDWFPRLRPPSPTVPADEFALAGVTVSPELARLLGEAVGERAAMALPTFFRGVQILTDVSGQLPWYAVRGGLRADQRRWAEPEVLDPQPMLLKRPSPFHTRSEVIRDLVHNLVLRGNAYVWLTGHDSQGVPTIGVPVNPDEVQVKYESDGLRRQYMWRERRMTPGDDFLHIHLANLPGSPVGLGPLEAARQAMGYALDQQKFGGEFFQKSATPAGVLEHPGRLDKDEADALRKAWDESHAGGRGTAITSGGLMYKPISITPEQAQFLATRAFSNQQIATLLGIPQHLLNSGQPQGTASSLTYANLSMVMEELYRMTISPVYLSRVEDAFSSVLPRGQSVRFDTADLLRTDDASRWRAEAVALDAGILTADEVRRLEGRAPFTPEQAQQVVDRAETIGSSPNWNNR